MRYRAFLGLGAAVAFFQQGIGALATLDFRRKERDPAIPPRPAKKASSGRKVYVPRPVPAIADRYTSIRKLECGRGLQQPSDKAKRRHAWFRRERARKALLESLPHAHRLDVE